MCRYDVQRRFAYQKHSGEHEYASGIGRKPFAFPSESLFAFSPESLFAFAPESFSRSPRNPFRLRPESAPDAGLYSNGPWHHRTAALYDSLKRLTSATNPESGTTSYTYDANGNVLTRVDARSITTTMVYDRQNRVTSKTYSNARPSKKIFTPREMRK